MIANDNGGALCPAVVIKEVAFWRELWENKAVIS